MANPEHVEIVKLGKGAIEAWRNANPGIPLDLEKAYLGWAKLSGADLSGANLSLADLSGADLSGTNLSLAHLSGADLSGADLSGANLHGAKLFVARFTSAKLIGTDFDDAILGLNIFGDCALSQAKNLDKVKHFMPSTIGIEVIYRSGGKIPEEFLLGAGVPENFITYIKSLVGQPIEFYTCFISYDSRDQAFADRLYADLRAKKVRCWYYPESAVWGRKVWEDIDRSIRAYDKLVVICSENSLVNRNVQREIEKALTKEQEIGKANQDRTRVAKEKVQKPELRDTDVLFPIRIDNYALKDWEHYLKTDVKGRTIGDFVGWDKDVKKYQNSFNRLLHGLDPKSWPAVGTLKPS